MYIYLTNSGGSNITSYNSTGGVVDTATFNASSYPDLVEYMLGVENDENSASSSVYLGIHDGTIINLEVTTGRNPNAADMAIYVEVEGDVLSDINAINSLL